jgi:uncharacterized membrane protein YbhN (UPF0104 family)
VTAVTASSEPVARQGVRWRRLLEFAVLIVVVGAIAQLLGWDVRGWFEELWDIMRGISAEYLLGAVVLITAQTTFTAYAWYSILRYAYPEGGVVWKQILGAYAASVALNSFLPANLGTLMLLVMLPTLIAGATFAGVLTGFGVEKIFFTLAGTFVYLYLFITVDGSFDIRFDWVHERPWLLVVIAVGIVILVRLLIRDFGPRVRDLWEKAKHGGQILLHPRAYFGRVFLPSLVGWAAGLGVTAVFLAAYGIPLTFHTVMSVTGGNSIANVTSITPGGVGVQQAFNVASLNNVTDATTATAYSASQQLVTTAWNIAFGIVALVWAFGWRGGKELVQESYVQARQKEAEQRSARKAKKQAKREAGAS